MRQDQRGQHEFLAPDSRQQAPRDILVPQPVLTLGGRCCGQHRLAESLLRYGCHFEQERASPHCRVEQANKGLVSPVARWCVGPFKKRREILPGGLIGDSALEVEFFLQQPIDTAYQIGDESIWCIENTHAAASGLVVRGEELFKKIDDGVARRASGRQRVPDRLHPVTVEELLELSADLENRWSLVRRSDIFAAHDQDVADQRIGSVDEPGQSAGPL